MSLITDKRFNAAFAESADYPRHNLSHKHKIAAPILMELSDYVAWSKIIGHWHFPSRINSSLWFPEKQIRSAVLS
ncbi:hypothetical protein TNCT_358171 [Trichonephila clavata]|uniref:Uncharacterized protein n=1 Tax=Trichonephila clavata TaxID=2740835 RepID=A0A8X6LNV8_TRICU|nr:hypothetical protein TNCT_358171 [Trichonephila clavata]